VTAYYNEIDPHAAQWLRNLMAADLIPAGDVDTRSIEDVTPNDLRGYTQCHFFAGIGGWAYALDLAGWPRDRPVWTGSCPCQPFSAAGKGNGFEDERHLWPAWQHLIAQRRPAIVFGEQVASKAADAWTDLVQSDLEGMGYAFGCVPFPAASVGTIHGRERNYWMARHAAYAERDEQSRQESCRGSAGRMGRQLEPVSWDEPWPGALSRLRAVDDGLPRNVAGCDAARNAIVPQAAAEFIRACDSAVADYFFRVAA
jgi:DNA (cytosine-5)-methyltransferase 1